MWIPPGQKSVDKGLFSTFSPTEVLYEFDGPRIFTLTDQFGGLNLAVWSDEDEGLERYLIAVSSPSIVAALKSGRTTVREALEQPRAWVCDVEATGQVKALWQVEMGEVPSDSLPKPGTMLLP